jgi:hypothetical protein
MTTTPRSWIMNQRALVDVVLHRSALRVPCIIREVRSTRILVELVDVPQRFWVGLEDVHEDASPSPPCSHDDPSRTFTSIMLRASFASFLLLVR